MKRKWTDQQLIDAVKISFNFQDVSKLLGLSNFGANSKTIKKYIKLLNIDTSHFLTTSEMLKQARAASKTKALTPLEDVFIENSSLDRKCIKRLIIENNLIPYECNLCKIIQWNNKPLSLHLDHINGINSDNRLENLRFLCPNCHSQTDTYCGRKLKNITLAPNTCQDCDKDIASDSTRCNPCNAIFRKGKISKIDWPSTNILIDMVNQYGYRGTGKLLGVTDNSVKKRIRNYPLCAVL